MGRMQLRLTPFAIPTPLYQLQKIDMLQHSTIAIAQRSCLVRFCWFHNGHNPLYQQRKFDWMVAWFLRHSPYYPRNLLYNSIIQISKSWSSLDLGHGTEIHHGNSRCHSRVSDNHRTLPLTAHRVIQQPRRQHQRSTSSGRKRESSQGNMFVRFQARARI